ncbi:glutathione S-transferase family protein [Aliamphritea ceti]|uniref:glutathione S-transferase family protein n=1 Tax=Aliamphritea ceti TaxID=1524258 RepID=UPI0021C2D50C|nr:glutathione S-transferase family protein [Aliamphritea ceti]
MSYQVYSAPDSANLVVQMILEQLDASYELCWLNRGQGEHRTETYLRLNPQGLIPTLVDGEHAVFETAAIALYLGQKYGQLVPASDDSVAYSRCLQWLFYLSNTLHADLRIQFYSDRYRPDDSEPEVFLTKVRARVLGHFKLLDEQLHKHSPDGWLLGEELSVCDFYLAALARWAALYPQGQAIAAEDLLSLPALNDFLIRMEQFPAVSRSIADQSVFGGLLRYPDPPDLPPAMVVG